MSQENRQIVVEIMGELARGKTAPFANAMAEDFTWRPMGSSQTGKWRPSTTEPTAKRGSMLRAQTQRRPAARPG
jgi:ketosteroid isomerase-like protein